MALLNLEREAAAIDDFDHALSIDQDFPGARDWRARASATLGDHKSAAEDRLHTLRRDPKGQHWDVRIPAGLG